MRSRAESQSLPGPERRPRRTTRRQWCIPPAITTHPGESLEGTTILHELPDGPAHALWTALREVTLWAALAPEARTRYLADRLDARLTTIAAAELDGTLAPVLTALASVVRADPADGPLLSLLCGNVADWALARGANGTAIHFAQAAALAHPEAAAPALRVGELALRARQTQRGETWLRRAVGLARRSGCWDEYAGAYVHLGDLSRTRNPKQAERCYGLAARAARRNGLGERVGAARHGLFLLRMDAGELAEAARLAAGAGRAYGRRHPALPRLRTDMAVLWMRQGDHARALRAFREILATLTDAAGRLRLHALAARAAAECGALAPYREHWTSAWSLLHDPRTAAERAAASLEMARAAALMRDVERVRSIARFEPARARLAAGTAMDG